MGALTIIRLAVPSYAVNDYITSPIAVGNSHSASHVAESFIIVVFPATVRCTQQWLPASRRRECRVTPL